ncbi:protein SMALL AUXIN UP-REGULATED RNA 54-like [Malus sylvestris]|uniref:protein SMALL AUXIN UP-REGULATED RNA 54-like n=1 Tax=Malus sylvestris TaxID=3752 RepID=UPI0021AD2F5D|nr:protein SMALL AUXIN UP-REGULATED RNA 54-like [Malus sylvestris]
MSTEKNIYRSKKAEDRGLLMLRLVIGKLVHKSLSILASRGPLDHHRRHNDFHEESEVATVVPGDIKEGYFAVFAVKGNEAERFVVKLESLSNPEFLRLLEEAKEEYGFDQKGAFAVPCRPEELRKILQNCRRNKRSSRTCININFTVIQGY